tara:strand:- start:50 stop:472 length:423 start_codon:yes stop_codon:yes gene_type:complete
MNYFYDLLPDDLKIYIIQLTSANIILHYWYKRINLKSSIIYSIIKLKYSSLNPINIPTFDVTNIIIAKLFLRASRVLSGTEDFVFWNNYIIYFAYSIKFCIYNNLTFTNNKFDAYNISEIACINLSHKFNINNIINNIIY